MTSLLIVGLLAVPPAGGEMVHPDNADALHLSRPVFSAEMFSGRERTDRLRLDYQSAIGSVTTPEITRTASKVQVPGTSALRNRKHSTVRQIVGAAVGAVGGFFLGGFAGAAIEGDSCNCDDPGF
jgi:predicted phage tail protein